MFKYVNDISELAQHIIKHFCKDFNVAIDATLGNGHDTDFLRNIFETVYAFDIQTIAVENYKDKNYKNVICINDSHHEIKNYVNRNIDCAMYNLGYLPGGNKEITTLVDTTLESIKQSLSILNSGGIITIAIYHGHEKGKIEKEKLISFLKNLDNKLYGVMLHSFINRSEKAPLLAIVEKK